MVFDAPALCSIRPEGRDSGRRSASPVLREQVANFFAEPEHLAVAASTSVLPGVAKPGGRCLPAAPRSHRAGAQHLSPLGEAGRQAACADGLTFDGLHNLRGCKWHLARVIPGWRIAAR